jgi:hypothetical protein
MFIVLMLNKVFSNSFGRYTKVVDLLARLTSTNMLFKNKFPVGFKLFRRQNVSANFTIAQSGSVNRVFSSSKEQRS